MKTALTLLALLAALSSNRPLVDHVAPHQADAGWLLADGDDAEAAATTTESSSTDEELRVIPPEVVSGTYLADGETATDSEDDLSDPPVSVSGGFLLADLVIDGQEPTGAEPPRPQPTVPGDSQPIDAGFCRELV